ncbi:MAG: ribonuclease HIII [Chthoniobacteraceae bacterium]
MHVCPLTTAQAEKLRALLKERGWEFAERPYMLFFADGPKVNVAVYEKGPKIVVAGKGTEEFVTFTLEPEILGVAKLGYEEVHDPAMFEPHFGIDESGKGDFFGPLTIAGCYTDREIARSFMDAGIQDSKRITSDKAIRDFARIIRETPGVATKVIVLVPQRYNEMYASFNNLNRLLAWGHAAVIGELQQIQPDCPRALSDQFANPKLIKTALAKRDVTIQLDARTKAESDLAVAAASILAREAFISWMERAGREYRVAMPRGASDPRVKTVAHELVAAHGAEVLVQVAKTHFKTAHEIAPSHYRLKVSTYRGKP